MPYKTPELRREHRKAYYRRTREARLAYARQFYEARRRILRDFKNRPCTDCRGWYEPCQMQFDHLDPATKLFCVGNRLDRKLETLLPEIRKCEIVCANCHALRTQRRRNAH